MEICFSCLYVYALTAHLLDAYELMQYAKMKAALSERDSVEGVGRVEKGCKPMLSVPGVVHDVSPGPWASKLSFFFVPLSFI